MSIESSPVGTLEKFQFSGKGKVYSYTIVRDAPTRFKEFEPYPLALIDLEEGPRITAMLTDIEGEWVSDGHGGEIYMYKVEFGMEVEMVVRRLWSEGPRGLIYYGYKFRPVLRP